ncbi:hypothetical protein ABZ695_29560 [Streptomyces sp. NPDC006976]|uniref:Uncharacterized protein n=1 Tax=Streptomyces castrisilvae TaxID=3033811 RepID=A0ABY9HSH9_9ACTN|nr:hypothetical protein [Streptomyces sp. Mut1]WLQ37049.1 hypothetical protein P8A18_28055 [Streptomyces sp. Mut1]
MDQHDSRHPEGSTPIYDRLLADWRAARAGPVAEEREVPGPSRAGGFVPAARSSGEAGRR